MAYEQRQYTESDAVKKFREQMEAQQALIPKDFQSQYRPQIDQTIDSIMTRKPFQYDVNADALYQQVAVMLPDEKTRRVGQSVAAASLPDIRK